MDYTPRESTVPNEQQLEEKAARYAELHPDALPAKRHQLIRRLRRVLRGRGENEEGPINTEAQA
jgi:hypothetical protein